ncbi:MAG: FecR domain-containing protein [Burkholderiaceae bacterium]
MAGESQTGNARTRQATEWLLQMREEPDDAVLRARVRAWISQSPANATAWAQVSEAYDLMGPASTPGTTPFRPLPQACAPRVRPRFDKRAIVGAAVAACAALIFVPGLWLTWRADYATGTAQQRTVTMADGSTVVLAPDSAVDIDDTDGARHVRLLTGRAFFEVRHDAARPFVVDAGAVRITDLGTAFDVALSEAGTDVAVAHGSVQVDRAGLSRQLTAGSWLRIGADARITQGQEPPAQVAAWRQGQLIARDRTMAEVVDELRPYFSGKIVVLGDSLAQRRVAGVYELSDPVSALRALARAHPGVTVRRVTPWMLVVSAS